MNATFVAGGAEATDEVSELIQVLSDAEERLALLTGGEVDAVLTREGRTFMLQRSQSMLRQHEALRQSQILDAVPASVALVDERGSIVSVNRSWREFEAKGAVPTAGCGVGANYLEVCDHVQGDDAALASEVARGLRSLLRGDVPAYSIEYACHSPSAERWFLLMISPLAGRPLSGAVVTHVDITDRTIAQRAVQRSRELLAAVITGTPDPVFVRDLDGRYLLCNDALAQLLGRSVEQMLGETNLALDLVGRNIISSDAAQERDRIDRLVIATGRVISSEDTVSTPTGPRTYLATKAPYRNASGETIGVIGMSRDISERKRAERQLQESQALLSMASRLANVGSWYVDVPPRKVSWSDALASMHGEAPGFSPTMAEALAYCTPEYRGGYTAAMSACLADGTPFDLEYQIATSQGRLTWVHVIGEAVRGDDGEIRRVQGALQDVSERRRAEQETRLLADRLTNILGSITDALLTLDSEWRFTFVNDEAARMLRRPGEILLGCNIWQAVPELVGTELEHALRQAMQERSGSRFELFHASVARWLGVSCYPSKAGLSIYCSDVTQQRKDQDSLRELNADLEARVVARTTELTHAREDAEQANRAKSAFLAAMSHEIRTPMNGVVGMIDVLEQSHLKSAQARIVKTVRESTYALLRIVDDVLDFSKIEAGHFHIDHEPVSLERVVAQVRDTLDHLASSKGVRLQVAIDARIPGQVLGDALRLRQILFNLVGNAIKFSSVEGHVGEVELRAALLSASEGLCRVEFAVLDNGIGMDEATCGRLFTPFMQADDSVTRRFGGTGLGLSISHRLALLMGGVIDVASRPGQGSCFTLRMDFDCFDLAVPERPLVDDDYRDGGPDTGFGDDVVTIPAALSTSSANQSSRLVLVAEDNETNRDVIRQQLALMGYAADIAANGLLALDLWRGGEHLLLLTDLHMPVLDGYELARTIRRTEAPGARMPIIALTANASKAEVRRCRDIGFDGHMTKPLRLLDLYEMLARWMPSDAQPLPLRVVPATRAPRPVAAAPTISAAASSPAIDLAVLSAIVGSEPAIIRTMLASFRRSANRCRDVIVGGIESGDCQSVADATHSLKSAARSIGAYGLAHACVEMEASAGGARAQELAAQLVRLEQELIGVFRSIDEAAP